MGIFKKIKEVAEAAKKDIEAKTSDVLMNEELNPTLRNSKDEPLASNKPLKKPKGDKQ